MFSSQDENQVKETSDQLEALNAHMDYVQENIADSQASIMEMEVGRISIHSRFYAVLRRPVNTHLMPYYDRD